MTRTSNEYDEHGDYDTEHHEYYDDDGMKKGMNMEDMMNCEDVLTKKCQINIY